MLFDPTADQVGNFWTIEVGARGKAQSSRSPPKIIEKFPEGTNSPWAPHRGYRIDVLEALIEATYTKDRFPSHSNRANAPRLHWRMQFYASAWRV
jgi:hypothetical protein